jgi:hypothetical protein
MPDPLSEADIAAWKTVFAAIHPDEDNEWMHGLRRAIANLDATRPSGDEALRAAAQAVVDEWDDSLRLWLAAGDEEGMDGPAMTAIRDPARETRRVANEAALRAALDAGVEMGLDVERLARALVAWGGEFHATGTIRLTNDGLDAARAIAREYAAARENKP